MSLLIEKLSLNVYKYSSCTVNDTFLPIKSVHVFCSFFIFLNKNRLCSKGLRFTSIHLAAYEQHYRKNMRNHIEQVFYSMFAKKKMPRNFR